jgi:hypothetical protein
MAIALATAWRAGACRATPAKLGMHGGFAAAQNHGSIVVSLSASVTHADVSCVNCNAPVHLTTTTCSQPLTVPQGPATYHAGQQLPHTRAEQHRMQLAFVGNAMAVKQHVAAATTTQAHVPVCAGQGTEHLSRYIRMCMCRRDTHSPCRHCAMSAMAPGHLLPDLPPPDLPGSTVYCALHVHTLHPRWPQSCLPPLPTHARLSSAGGAT